MIFKSFVALLALLASGPLSYAVTLSDAAARDVDTGGVVALPLDGVKITSPDGKRAWFVNETAAVEWTSTIPSNRFWLTLTVKNSQHVLYLGPILSQTGRVSFIADLEPGEYIVEFVPRYDFYKNVRWQTPTILVVRRPQS